MNKETDIDFAGGRFRPDRMVADEQGKSDFWETNDPRKLLMFMIYSASTI
jgi:hypothetical protein